MFLLTKESATHTQTYIHSIINHVHDIKLLTLNLNRGDFDPVNIFVKRSLLTTFAVCMRLDAFTRVCLLGLLTQCIKLASVRSASAPGCVLLSF